MHVMVYAGTYILCVLMCACMYESACMRENYHGKIIVHEVHNLLVLKLGVSNHIRKQHRYHDLRERTIRAMGIVDSERVGVSCAAT